MSILDIILILILFAFSFFGFWAGFLQSLGSLIGVGIGAYVGGRYYPEVASWLSRYIKNEQIGSVVSFALIFGVVNKLTGLVFYLIDRIFKIVSLLPFLKTFNRIFGAILGSVEGIFALGLVLYFLARFPISETFTSAMQNSQVAQWLVRVGNVFVPLLPDLLNKVRSII